MSLGTMISKYRKELCITQESLARQLEVTNQAVSKWESDQCCPDVQLLPRLADVFGITLDELFGRETPQKNQIVLDLPWEDDGCLRGVLYKGWKLIDYGKRPKLQLFFKKKVEEDVYSDFAVVCGDVKGCVEAKTSVHCAGVGGYIETEGDVTCQGNVDGYIEAGGDVSCQDVVNGYVSAGGDVSCQDVVNGYVEAGGDVACRDVSAGYVSAGGDVTCSNVDGSIDAGGSVTVKK